MLKFIEKLKEIAKSALSRENNYITFDIFDMINSTRMYFCTINL